MNIFSKRPAPSPRLILSSRIGSALQTLLESKHLYQSVEVDFSTDNLASFGGAKSPERFSLTTEWMSLQARTWIIEDPESAKNNQAGIILKSHVVFQPPDIKTFCGQCDRVEPFNLLFGRDFLAHGKALNEPVKRRGQVVQVFVVSYLCQSCKNVPEVFLVRREGGKLTLSGRTPIEHVEVPSVMPKTIREFYSGALVAHQSGQTLAANFLLRTLIEQFANSKSTNAKTADDALDQYMDGLPADFKTRFPSFRDMYSTLSADIHSAKGSNDVFDESRSKIVKHFEARKLFDLG